MMIMRKPPSPLYISVVSDKEECHLEQLKLFWRGSLHVSHPGVILKNVGNDGEAGEMREGSAPLHCINIDTGCMPIKSNGRSLPGILVIGKDWPISEFL